MMNRTRTAGFALMLVLVAIAVAAPLLAPNPPAQQHADLAYAPPMLPRIVDANGSLTRPFIYPLVLADRLEKRYEPNVAAPVALRFFADGRLVSTGGEAVWLPLGADPLARDVFSRLLYGARLSLLVAATATLLAILIGALTGSLAGYAGGAIDRALMAFADVVVILPAAYVVLTLRAAMPLVMSREAVFWTIVLVLAAASWPVPARGVRAIIAAERSQAYAEAAYAAGAGPLRILLRHLLPAARSHLSMQAFLLFPAFILAEATLSYLGLGFAIEEPSWGVMLQDASASVIGDAPWILAPAGAIVVAVLATHFVTSGRRQAEPSIRL